MKNLTSISRAALSASSTRRAFTLIELLVVIAIISILASILFPVFGRARENARRSSCASNLKQIALGVTMYTQDYDERFPPRSTVANQAAGSYCTEGTAGCTWIIAKTGNASLLEPYTKSSQIVYCPSDTSSQYLGSYGYNALISNTALAGVQTPSETLLFADDTFGNHTLYPPVNTSGIAQRYVWGQNFFNQVNASPGAADEGKGMPYGRHFGGVNASFCDGHVKFIISAEKLYNGGNNRPFYDGS